MGISPRFIRLLAVIPVLLFPLPGARVGAQPIQLKKVWEVGSIAGPDQTIWERITDATILDGTVFASDGPLAEVRAFTLEGKHLVTLGGRGQGPGEFAFPGALSVTGDTLRVLDIVQRRWVFLEANGKHIRTLQLDYSVIARYVDRMWKGRGEWWVAETGLVGHMGPPERSISDHLTLAWRVPSEVDTVAVVAGNPYWDDLRQLDYLYMDTVEDLGPDGGSWMVGDSLLVVIDGVESSARLLSLSEEGLKEVRTRRLPGRREEMTEEDRDAAIQAHYDKMGNPKGTWFRTPSRVPDYWSAWTRVRADDQAMVWLRRGGLEVVDPTRGERWVRWSLADDSLREMEAPPGIEILQFREGYAVGLRRDGLGVEYLVLLQFYPGD